MSFLSTIFTRLFGYSTVEVKPVEVIPIESVVQTEPTVPIESTVPVEPTDEDEIDVDDEDDEIDEDEDATSTIDESDDDDDMSDDDMSDDIEDDDDDDDVEPVEAVKPPQLRLIIQPPSQPQHNKNSPIPVFISVPMPSLPIEIPLIQTEEINSHTGPIYEVLDDSSTLSSDSWDSYYASDDSDEVDEEDQIKEDQIKKDVINELTVEQKLDMLIEELMSATKSNSTLASENVKDTSNYLAQRINEINEEMNYSTSEYYIPPAPVPPPPLVLLQPNLQYYVPADLAEREVRYVDGIPKVYLKYDF